MNTVANIQSRRALLKSGQAIKTRLSGPAHGVRSGPVIHHSSAKAAQVASVIRAAYQTKQCQQLGKEER